MEIVCEFKKLTWSSGEEYTAVVKEVKNQSSSSTITKFSEESGKAVDSRIVRGISFTNIHLDVFPKGLDKVFPNIRCVSITHGGLKKVRRSDFAGLTQVINLELGNNDLESLPDDLFMDMPNLQRIRLSNNRISRMSSKTLLQMKNSATRVILSNNTLIDDIYFKDTYGSFESLLLQIDEKCLPSWGSHLGRLEKLFRSGKASDVTVRVGENSFKAHKSFLMAQSPVLEKAIAADMEECQSNVISIDGFSSQVVENMLLFCYIGRVDCYKDQLLELFEAAVAYKMRALQTYCEQYFIKNKIEMDDKEINDLTARFSDQKLHDAANTDSGSDDEDAAAEATSDSF